MEIPILGADPFERFFEGMVNLQEKREEGMNISGIVRILVE